MTDTCISTPPHRLSLLFLVLSLGAPSTAFRQTQHGDNVCQSVECVTLSAEITSRMNASADPCKDFYNYACGNFPNVVKYNPLKADLVPMSVYPDEVFFEDTIGLMAEKLEKNMYELLALDRVVSSNDTEMSELYNFTRLFYRSCRRWHMTVSRSDGRSDYRQMSADILRGVYSHLDRTMRELWRGIGPLPIETLLAALVKAGGVSIVSISLPRSFAEEVISNDDYNLTKSARARVELNIDHFYYDRVPPLNNVIRFLETEKIGIPELGKLSFNGSRMFNDTYAKLRSALANSLPFENCTMGAMRKFKVADLDRLAKCARPSNPFSWTRFFEDLLQEPVDPAAWVEVDNPGKLTRFVTFFKSRQTVRPTGGFGTPAADATFLIVDWLLSFAVFLPMDVLEKGWPTNKPQVISVNKAENSATACMVLTKTLLQPIVERMYQRAYHREDFKDINQLVQLIKNASMQSVRQQSWITPSAKVSIVRKIQSMKQSIGLDDLTASELKSFYNDTLIEFRETQLQPGDPGNNFGSLVSIAQCAYARKNLEMITGGSPVSMFMDINPLVVNAFNWVEKNQIIFPMAILSPPVYHPNYPDYINIGSLGYIIGHEIGHSFDNLGHTINQMGASGHFWDGRTEERYLERMECVRSRYGSYPLYPGGRTHNSNSTLGNDIADIIGIKAAAEALKILKKRAGRRPMPRMPNLPAQLSQDQLLFIQAAQGWCLKSEPKSLDLLFGDQPTHSPHHLRVRGIAENNQEFADAFKCRDSAAMNPKNKCTFW